MLPMALAPLLAALLAWPGAAVGPADALALVQRGVRERPWHRRFDQYATTYQAGKSLEFHVAGQRWLNCTVVAVGDKPNTYAIHVPELPVGHQEIHDVPGTALRDPKKEAAHEASRRQAEKQLEIERRKREEKEDHTFEDNEEALMAGSGKAKGTWFRARILGPGRKPNSYDVRFKNVTIENVQQSWLKKTKPTVRYEVCEPVEVMTGANGSWIRSKILGPGSDAGLYNIRYPGSLDTVLPDMPVVALRKYKANQSSDGNASLGEAGNATSNKTSAFQVGETMWIQLDSPTGTMPWVACTITSIGEWSETYNVRVGKQIPPLEICDVPAFRLRETSETLSARAREEQRLKDEEEARQAALGAALRAEAEAEERRREEEVARQAQQRVLELEEAKERAREAAVNKIRGAAKYSANQSLQFNTLGSNWVNCTVVSLALTPNTYNIFVPSFPEGLQDVGDVKEQSLRTDDEAVLQRFEEEKAHRKLLEAFKAKKDREHVFEQEERVQVTVKGMSNTWVNAVIKRVMPKPGWYMVDVNGERVAVHGNYMRRDPEHDFEDGETVQFISNGIWLPCTVTRRGAVANSYNIYFPSGPVGHRDIHNVDAKALRRMKFVPGQPVEVYIKKGPSANLWLEAEVVAAVASMQDTYTVHVFDALHEFNVQRMPYKLMRISQADAARFKERHHHEEQRREEERKRKARAEELEERWLRNHSFEEGESVQVRSAGHDSGSWINMTVVSKGSKPDTYNVHWTKRKMVFTDVQRRNIRKDPESQALKVRDAEEGKQRLEEQEARREKAAQVRTKLAEEEFRRDQERKRREANQGPVDVLAEAGAVAPLLEQDDDVTVVTPEDLAKMVADTQVEVAKEEERLRRIKSISMPAEKAEPETQVLSDEEEYAKRQAEWEEALKADGEEADSSPATPQDEDAKRQAEWEKSLREDGGETQEVRTEEKPAAKPTAKPAAQPEKKPVEYSQVKDEEEEPTTPAPVWEMDEETADAQAEWEAAIGADDIGGEPGQ